VTVTLDRHGHHDLDAMADHHPSDMRQPHRPLGSRNETEAFAANADIGG